MGAERRRWIRARVVGLRTSARRLAGEPFGYLDEAESAYGVRPELVTVINEVFSPTQEQYDWAWDILEAYEHATEGEGKGAVMFGDEMIDEASRKMAKFVKRASAPALPAPPVTAD